MATETRRLQPAIRDTIRAHAQSMQAIAQARATLAKAAPRAAMTLVKASQGEDVGRDGVRAADSILDRTLGKATQVIDSTIRHEAPAIELSDEEILRRLEAGGIPVPIRLRAAIQGNPIIDAQPVESPSHNSDYVKSSDDPPAVPGAP